MTVGWEAAAGAIYDLYYVPFISEQHVNFDSFPPTLENISTNGTTLEGLDYDTKYALYIRKDCAGDNEFVSRWNGPIFFETPTGICAYATTLQLCEEGEYNQST